MEQGFICDEKTSKNLTKVSWTPQKFVCNEVTMENNDIAERLDKFFNMVYSVTPWTKFLRRDFLIANKIDFPHVKIAEDVLWSFKIVCLAERWLCLPERLYIYRKSSNSMMRKKRTPQDEIKFWLDPLVKGLDYLDDFMKRDFFNQNPNFRFDVINFFVKMQIAGMLDALKNLNRYQLYQIINEAFSDSKYAPLIAYLFVVMNFYRDKFLEVK